jgi:hypothetical protein
MRQGSPCAEKAIHCLEEATMWRRFSVALSLGVLLTGVASAQDWTRQMFTTFDHDFGSVATRAKAEFEFVVTNPWVEDVHIASVRSSCGCTSVRIENPTIKSWETGKIIAHFNTHLFTGRKGATITVTFDRPLLAEVQLHVGGFIRNDLAFNPNSVDFGSVEGGAATERLVNIGYAGYSNWQITAVRSSNPHLRGELTQLSRDGGQVLYQLTVHLDKSAPEGYFRDHMMLATSDSTETPILVEGRVESQITASPGTLMLGPLEPGHAATKPIVLKAKQPFRIVKITCPDQSFKFAPDKAANLLHVVPVTFQAGNQTGKIQRAIRIETDLGKVLEVPAFVVVANPFVAAQ